MPTTPIHKPELLAPAGREDVLWAVLEAGADAVYLSGKRFNMRRHRRDFHFGDADLARLVPEVHRLGRRVYVTVNILLAEAELPDAVECLRWLAAIGVDAAIVQDLAIPALCQAHGIALPLHASTMVNVGSAEAARLLRRHGFTRIVTSRDITLEAVRRIREEAAIEVEYFVHGDLCSVQSGQCLASGLIFGKSSNRGQCMKPCRWAYDLIETDSGQVLASGQHLLAAKDMCLLQHIPELLRARVDAFKIEGRMRSADVLAPIVASYRAAIDRAMAEPLASSQVAPAIRDLHQRRVRNLTSGFAFDAPGPDFFDASGDREPVFLSTYGSLSRLPAAPAGGATERPAPPAGLRAPLLAVWVGTPAVGAAAVAAGAEVVLLSWEGDLRTEAGWRLAEIRELARACRHQGATPVLCSPEILTERELGELALALDNLPEVGVVEVAGLAAIEALAGRDLELWGGPGLNVINSGAVAGLARFGIERFCLAPEASLDDAATLATRFPGQTMIAAHGPIRGMVAEHCLIAGALGHGHRHAVCLMPCAAGQYVLRDRHGNARPLRTDRYCRNHLFLEHELTVLPILADVRRLPVGAWRLDARLMTPEQAAGVIAIYRQARDASPDPSLEAVGQQASQALQRLLPGISFSLGAYPNGIGADAALSRLQIKKEEQDELRRRGDPPTQA